MNLLKENSTSEIESLRHERRKLEQQNKNNVLEVISPVVDASFNSLKHFIGLQNVLKEIRSINWEIHALIIKQLFRIGD